MDQNIDPESITRLSVSSEQRSIGEKPYPLQFREKESESEDIAELFHENTKMQQVLPTFGDSTELFMRSDEASNGAFSSYADKEDLPLSPLPEAEPPDGSLQDTIEHRRSVREYDDVPITTEQLSSLLRYGCGTVDDDPAEQPEHAPSSRGYPSAGGLYPIEPYLVVTNAADLDEGIYYYSAEEHGLRLVEQLSQERATDTVESFVPSWQMEHQSASVLFILASVFWRNKVKYGPRGYRFGLLEAGHIMQNVQLVAAGLGLGACSLGGLDEDEVDPALGLNGVDQSTVYGCLLGTPADGGDADGY